MEINKDTDSHSDESRRQKKRWNTPALTEFGKVSSDNQPRAALGTG
jgi:hypothetical protein